MTFDDIGTLTFNEADKNDNSHWFILKKLEPENELVEFYIYSDSNGISDNQKSLMIEIENRYSELAPIFESYINTELRKHDQNSNYLSLKKELEISSISIQDSSTEINKWEIDYVDKNGFTFYEIAVENFTPIHFSISA